MAGLGDSLLPASIRYNNPGAMNFGPFAQGLGASQAGRFAHFSTPEAGWAAMDRLLGIYAGRGQNTVSSIIGGTPDNPNRAWAPRGVDNNSTDTYISTVARRLGLGANDVIPQEMMPRLAEAMASYEAGRPVTRPGAAAPAAQTAQAAPQPAQPEQPGGQRMAGLLDWLIPQAEAGTSGAFAPPNRREQFGPPRWMYAPPMESIAPPSVNPRTGAPIPSMLPAGRSRALGGAGAAPAAAAAPLGVPGPMTPGGGIGSDYAASPPAPPQVPPFDEGVTSFDPETTMRLAQAEHARQNPPVPAPRRPGLGESLENWMTSPLFQAAVALATQRDPAAAMASAGQFRRQQSEYERQQSQRSVMDRIWGEAFPNGQPNMNHPLLRAQSPEVAAMLAGMGPEAAIPQLATAAMNRSKIDYRTLKEGEQLVATTGSGQVMPVPGVGGGSRAPEAIRTDAAKVNQAFNNITAALDDYQRRINASGPVWRPGTARDAITQQITNIQLQLKELFNLGVLNGPDLALMQGMLPDPNLGAGNLIADKSLAERTQAAVRNLKEILRQRRDNANAAAGTQPLPMPQPRVRTYNPQTGNLE